jgi:RES domain-containing protein
VTPLPGALDGVGDLIVWRLDTAKRAAEWNTGEGAFKVGGRWNSRGVRAVYCSVDPSTAILEVAVHKTFPILDSVPHTLSEIAIDNPASVHVVTVESVPDPNWLMPGVITEGQQVYGDNLLLAYSFILIPSVVSRHSWNLIFSPETASGAYSLKSQERFALDPRLSPVK